MPLAWRYPKDPNEILDYDVDWSKQMTADTDSIITSLWFVPDGITKESDAFTMTSTKIILSGGTAGAEYEITNRILTTEDRTFERTILLRVEER